MEIEEMKRRLKSAEKITFSKHFHGPKVQIRGISEDEVNYCVKKCVKAEAGNVELI